MKKKVTKQEAPKRSYSLEVGTAEQYQDIEQNETRLRVPFQILDTSGKKPIVLTERIESFPLSATEKDVKETLKRHLTVYQEDLERFEANQERQAGMEQSQKLAGGISNLVIE